MGEKRNNLEAFFKYFDRYSKSVTLTYRQKGSFETSCGGIMSIISFFILAWWLITELYSKFIVQPTYSTSDGQSLTQNSHLDWPSYELSGKQFFVTYRMTIEDNTIPEEELLEIFTPLWIQYRYNETTKDHDMTFHEAIPCN